MNNRRNLGFIAGAATIMSAVPLAGIFQHWTWMVQSIFAVGLITATATGVRALRGRVATQGLAMFLVLFLTLTLLFSNGHSLLGFIPTPETVAYFGRLLGDAGTQIRDNGVPVEDLSGLLFLTVFGIGVVGILTDLFTVGLRRPALSGLPMLAIYAVPVAVFPDSVSIFPFMIGAVGYLWLLVADNTDRVRRFGRRFTGDGRDVDAWESSPLTSAGRRLAVVGVLAAVVLPVMVPTFSTSVFDSFGGEGNGPNRGGNGKGGPATVNLFADLAGRLNQTSVQDLVKVTTTEGDPYYLKFGVADELTSSGFKTRTPSGQAIGSADLPDPNQRPSFGVSREKYTAQVQIGKNFDMPMLPVYAEPVSTQKIGSDWAYDPNMGIVFSLRSRSGGRSYQFDYVRSIYTPDELNSSPELSADNALRRQYTQVPLVVEVNKLVEDLTKNAKTPYEKVRALYDYFSTRNGFRYSLSTVEGTSGQKIVDFLHNKTGFCEQYAAALAWMVRTAGIPARVAFGFTRGSNVRTENGQNVYQLTNRNLHAWTEVYFEGFGWVPFDATPSTYVAGSVASDWAPDVNRPTAAPSVSPGSVVPGGGGDDVNPRGDNNHDPNAGLDANGQPITPAPVWPWYLLGGVVLVIVVLSLPMLLRRRLRRRRSRQVKASQAADLGEVVGAVPDQPGVMVIVSDSGADRARELAHEAWDELLDTLIDFRVPADAAETPRTAVRRLIEQQELPAEAATGARQLAMAEERARYARTPLDPEPLSGSLRAIRRYLISTSEWRVRVYAVLMPPSVTARWRLAFLDGVSGTAVKLSRMRVWLSRFNPRRVFSRG
ncbi:transglutaminase TgpA family protein [Hamadaea tsunoensis]|uniref:transglutaminase TgpA family protein n=1 Tax=Hamadaea tsunoensis TaxID=53368 RepID=UPI000411C91C|nr:DUF3488 and transglutaminase-like domain-containing protein [Hamadaea tsunoensis]